MISHIQGILLEVCQLTQGCYNPGRSPFSLNLTLSETAHDEANSVKDLAAAESHSGMLVARCRMHPIGCNDRACGVFGLRRQRYGWLGQLPCR